MDVIRKHSSTFLIVMKTHIGFHKTKSYWDSIVYVIVHYVDVCGQSGGIWVLKKNGINIVMVVHDVFIYTITITLSLGTSSCM